ncbi:MAG TPA: NAD(P)/FAD-dependent oxidoreductase [Candidatus Binatia bacterium]|nr:NAD(P)/FAD-dependent oxidoreductase [Candidatus Binatia bacterium]
MASDALPHVVIIGGGFGGLYAAQRLRRAPVRVTVIDQHNHHLFQPLLYQVAMAGLSPGDIAYPIRAILRRQQNTWVVLAKVSAVELATRTVRTDSGEAIGYDYLILAAGVSHAYFGHEEWEPFAPGLKSLDDALEMRRRVLLAFERAEQEKDPEQRAALMTFVIVGAGPTGVELAGALADIARTVLASDFRSIDPREARIALVEAGPRVLPTFPEQLSTKAEASLRRLGVEVISGQPVTMVDARGVCLGKERIDARTVLWAAGVTASPLSKTLGVALDRSGRVLVEKDLSIPGHPEAFVIGDLASLRDDKTGKPVPGLAPAAMQEGRRAADNIVLAAGGKPTEAFHYVDKGNLATIGKASAVADFGFLRISGLIAWLLWIVVHILFLIGFRNRVIVVFEWAWAYFTSQRGARLITGELGRLPGQAPDRGTLAGRDAAWPALGPQEETPHDRSPIPRA